MGPSKEVSRYAPLLYTAMAHTYLGSEFTQRGLDDKDLSQLKTQTELAKAWKELNHSFASDRIHVVPSIQDAVNTARNIRKSTDKQVDTLVAGSLLLVGGLIEVAGLTRVALEV